MNTFLQIGIVLAVVWVILLLITILKKTFSTNRILLLLTVLLVGAGCIFASTRVTSADEDDYIVSQENADRYFAVIYAQGGDYESAITLFSKSAGVSNDKESLLALARLSALNNNFSKAKLYYTEYLKIEKDESVEDELAYVETYVGTYTASNNGAILDYLEANGLSLAEAGFADAKVAIPDSCFTTDSEFQAAVLDRLVKTAESELSGMDANRIRNCAERISYVNNLLYQYPNVDTSDEQLITAAKELNSIVNGESDLSRNENVRNAALAANALLGDAKAVAKAICEYSTVYELSVATELYVSGYVDELDFRAFPDAPDKYMVSDVTSQCKDILRNAKSKLTDEQKASYESAIELIQSSGEDYVLKHILVMFTQKAATESFGERSKFYLEAAKGYDYANMDRRVSEYIDNALENSAIASDYEYAAAMTGIIKIISNDSTESVQKLSTYSKTALDRLMPVPMDNFKRKAEEAKEIGKNESGYKQMAYTAPVSFDEEGEDDDFDFTATFTERVTQKKSTINIGEIDKKSFPVITTRFSFGDDAGITEDNIKNKIAVYDCDNLIKNYEVRKIKNQTGKIILLCDMSGSMSGSDGELRQAVINFAESKTDSEQVAVVGFESSIVFQSAFLTDKDEIKEYASRIYAGGGTSIYPSILSVAEMFSDDVNDNNVIIVMTDGQDGSRPSDSTLIEQLNILVAEHNCTIYTVGLGSGVENGYLEQIAACGNGQYLYVDSAASLSSFYEFMHSQLSNSYVITYSAVDKVKNDRTLTVEYKDSIGNATKHYTLSEDGTNSYEGYEKDKFDVRNPDSLQVYGFKTSYLYAGSADVKAALYGCNFKQGEKYEIKLSGPVRSYTLNYEYVSATELSVVIPYTVAPGTYSIKVSSADESASVSNALKVVAPTDQKQFKFGSYVFTCDDAKSDSNGITLSGHVTLNGWLYFKGNVSFTGDCNDEVSSYCTMTDKSGSYIKYSKNGSTGFTNFLARNGISIPLPSLGSVKIYSETYSPKKYKDFPVDKCTLNAAIPVNGLADVGGTVCLYPDMVYSEVFYTDLDLKYLKNLIKNLPTKIFQKNVSGSLAITNTCFLVKASYEIDYDKDNDTDKNFQFGKIGFYIKKFGFDIDTISENYSVEGAVGFKAFKLGNINGVKGFGLKLKWNGDGFDAFTLSADVKQTVSETPVPLTISKMSIGASNLSQVKDLSSLLKVTVTGGFNLGAGDIIEKVPAKVKEFFDMDSLALAELDDAKINVTLGEFNINFESNIKVLGFKVGKGKIEVGKMDYSNAILNINETEYGVDVALSIYMNPSWKNLSAIVDGTGRVTLGYPFGGLTANGELGYNIEWFLFDWGADMKGDFGIGVYFNSKKEAQFIVKAYGQTDGLFGKKYKGFRIDISKSMGTQKKKY